MPYLCFGKSGRRTIRLCSLERALARRHPVRIDRPSAIPAPLFGSAAPGQRGARPSPGGEITSPSAKTHGDACNHTTAAGPLSRLVGAGGLASRSCPHQSPAGAPRPGGTEAGIAWSCVRCLPVPRPVGRQNSIREIDKPAGMLELLRLLFPTSRPCRLARWQRSAQRSRAVPMRRTVGACPSPSKAGSRLRRTRRATRYRSPRSGMCWPT
jgi:hypothetical protein